MSRDAEGAGRSGIQFWPWWVFLRSILGTVLKYHRIIQGCLIDSRSSEGDSMSTVPNSLVPWSWIRSIYFMWINHPHKHWNTFTRIKHWNTFTSIDCIFAYRRKKHFWFWFVSRHSFDASNKKEFFCNLYYTRISRRSRSRHISQNVSGFGMLETSKPSLVTSSTLPGLPPPRCFLHVLQSEV